MVGSSRWGVSVGQGKGVDAKLVGEAGLWFAVNLVEGAFEYVIADAVAESGDDFEVVLEQGAGQAADKILTVISETSVFVCASADEYGFVPG